MAISMADLLGLARDTLRDPRGGARMVMAQDLPQPARWWALAVMAIGSALLTHASLALLPPADQAIMAPIMSSPIRTAILQGMILLATVHGVHWLGRWRGGQGRFEDALILVVWLQFILLGLQVLQLIAEVLVPPLAGLIGIAGVVLFFWLLTHFVAELHGFRSLGLVFAGVLLAMFSVGLLIGLLLISLAGTAP